MPGSATTSAMALSRGAVDAFSVLAARDAFFERACSRDAFACSYSSLARSPAHSNASDTAIRSRSTERRTSQAITAEATDAPAAQMSIKKGKMDKKA